MKLSTPFMCLGLAMVVALVTPGVILYDHYAPICNNDCNNACSSPPYNFTQSTAPFDLCWNSCANTNYNPVLQSSCQAMTGFLLMAALGGSFGGIIFVFAVVTWLIRHV